MMIIRALLCIWNAITAVILTANTQHTFSICTLHTHYVCWEKLSAFHFELKTKSDCCALDGCGMARWRGSGRKAPTYRQPTEQSSLKGGIHNAPHCQSRPVDLSCVRIHTVRKGH